MATNDNPIRVGFVGLSVQGWAAVALAPPILTGPLASKYSLTAVSTTNATSASASAEKYSELTGKPVKSYHGDAAAIADDADVDLVAISVKTPYHKTTVTPAIERGKDVFVEWPLGNGLEESLEIAEAAKRKGVRTLCGMQAWQNLAVLKAREWVASGKIGRVLSATWVCSKPEDLTFWAPFTGVSDAYTADPTNGATFLTIGIGHHMSAITRILGPLKSISASSSRIYDTIHLVDADRKPTGETLPNVAPDQFVAHGVFKNHPGALFSATWRSGITCSKETDKHRPTLTFLIDGDKGFIKFESYGVGGSLINMYLPEKVYLNGEEVKLDDEPRGPLARNWEAYAKGAEGEYATFDDAVILYKHIDAITTSAKEGRIVPLDV
ncbi:oxidoreductase [Exidia glandulosa HHB12029]|uniref:Oxidoreductase n=1 Tax=Exidia glandulosa HHB12029 TaxID=1314781 RepID=A0A165ZJ04_EXIGL|nr:oxidoreductase [Exidia glandulosa HHB12029]